MPMGKMKMGMKKSMMTMKNPMMKSMNDNMMMKKMEMSPSRKGGKSMKMGKMYDMDMGYKGMMGRGSKKGMM